MKGKITAATILLLLPLAVRSQQYLMNATLASVTDCNGYFLDSGGNADTYGPNQDLTTTICPDMSSGTHIQLIFNGTQLGAGDNLCFFDGQDVNAPSLGCAADFAGSASFIIQATAVNTSGCLTITFSSDGADEAAGWSADINCIPACQLIQSVLDSSSPSPAPLDTGWIDICPGDRVFFWGKGSYPQDGAVYNHSDLTSDFEWDFGDGTFTFGPNVSHRYDEPGGYVLQLKITDQFGCKNTNFISQRIRVAPYPTFLVGDVTTQVCAGDTISLSASLDTALAGNSSIVPVPGTDGFQTAGIRSDSLALPDGNGASYSTSISFSDFSPGQSLSDITDLLGIFVNMEHSWMRDLQIKIFCPNGQGVILHNHPGPVGGQVFLGQPFEMDEGLPTPVPGVGYSYGWAPNPDFNFTWIDYANAFAPATLPEGTYAAFEDLEGLLGCPLNGEWTIEVTDLWAIDNGYIFSWSIAFDPSLYPSIETFSPAITDWGWVQHPSLFYYQPDSIAGIAQNAGEIAYQFRLTDEFGCTWDTTLDIRVLPLTHPDCYACQDLLAPPADTSVCQGEPVSFDVGVPVDPIVPVTFASFENYPIGAGNHPPSNPYQSPIGVNSLYPTVVSDPLTDILSVCLDLETDFDGDIQLFLVSPNNQVLMLSTNNGGSGDNYTQTCFTPVATVPITAGSPPFTGDFQPEGAWSVLQGAPINGTWKLRISDSFGTNAYGELNWWSITFNTQNGVTYTWLPNAGLSCNQCPDPTATPAGTTEYVVTALNNYGCTVRDTVLLSVINSASPPLVTVSYQSPGVAQVTWTDTNPGLAYEVNINGAGWTAPNNGALSHLVSGLNNGDPVNAAVRAVEPTGLCAAPVGTGFYTYQFCPIQLQTLDSPPFSVSCHATCDAAVQLVADNAQSPVGFQLGNLQGGSNLSSADGSFTALCPGSYLAVAADASGCADSLVLVIDDVAALSAEASVLTPVSCSGGSDGCAVVEATGGTGSISFTWSNVNQSNSDTLCSLPEGNYSVTATDANGCQAVDTVLLDAAPSMVLTLSATPVLCFGGQDGTAAVAVVGGNGSYTFLWNAGFTPDAPETGGLSAGSYGVTVTDGNGCTATGSVSVPEPAAPLSVSLTQTDTSCFGSLQSSAVAMATGGTPPYAITWNPGGITGNTLSLVGPGTYAVTASDANGCAVSDSIALVEWPDFNILISSVPPSCHDLPDGQLAVVVLAGGDGVYSFSWNTGQTQDYLSALAGGQTYTVTVTDNQGCTGTQSRFLDNPDPLQFSLLTTDVECHGDSTGTVTVSNVLHANGSLQFSWTPNTGGQSSSSAVQLPAGAYGVTVTDTNGCAGTAFATVTEATLLVPVFQVVNNSCFGYEEGQVSVSVTGGKSPYDILWASGATADTLRGLPAGSYTLTITDATGCSLATSATVTAPATVEPGVEVEPVSCFGGRDGKVTIETTGGTPPYRFSLDGDQFQYSNVLIALEAGAYDITILDAKGCRYAASALVEEPPALSAEILVWNQAIDEYITPYGDSVPLLAAVLHGVGDLTYFWEASYCGTLFQEGISDCDQTPFSNAVWAKPSYSVDYFLTVTDENGCEASDMVQLHVRKERIVEVPTGFSPNGDGLHERLLVHGGSGTRVGLFQVFDRWGERLFEDADFEVNAPDRGWDGTYRANPMPPGVYVWFLEVTFPDGSSAAYRGESTLLR